MHEQYDEVDGKIMDTPRRSRRLASLEPENVEVIVTRKRKSSSMREKSVESASSVDSSIRNKSCRQRLNETLLTKIVESVEDNGDDEAVASRTRSHTLLSQATSSQPRKNMEKFVLVNTETISAFNDEMEKEEHSTSKEFTTKGLLKKDNHLLTAGGLHESKMPLEPSNEISVKDDSPRETHKFISTFNCSKMIENDQQSHGDSKNTERENFIEKFASDLSQSQESLEKHRGNLNDSASASQKSKVSPSNQKVSKKNILDKYDLSSDSQKPDFSASSKGGFDINGCWPDISDAASLWINRNESSLLNNLKAAYSFNANIDGKIKLLTNDLITTNQEVVWQQIAFLNKRLLRYFSKQKYLLNSSVPTTNTYLSKSAQSDNHNLETSFIDENMEDNQNDMTDTESEDLFNLKENNLADLDSKLPEKNEELSNENIKTKDLKKKYKYAKSSVDDRFFSLAEMEDFLNKEEPTCQREVLESIDDDDNSSEHFADYFHEQFYGDDNANGARVDRKVVSEKEKEGRKKVRFVVEANENIKKGDNINEIEKDKRILLGVVASDDDIETDFQKYQKKLRKKIFELEESNLAPKSWELSGEVTAFNRSENALLEQHIDFDHAAKLPPLVTVDTTRKLESMITQRIRDKIFDDVERKVRESESEVKYRAAVEEQYTKKSLVEVYEEQYQKIHGVVNEGKVDEKVIEIGKMMSSLFRKLDALSHYNYIPPEVYLIFILYFKNGCNFPSQIKAQSEIHIVNNMPALQREEVGPTASTNEMLIAPEEIKKHIKGTLKNKDERNETDRARERRKKKRALHLKRLKNSVFIDRKKDKKVEKKIKKCKEKRLEERSVKSSKFFEQLQRTTADEIQKKSMSKIGSKINASVKYKL